MYEFELRVDDGIETSLARVIHVAQADDDHVPRAEAGPDRREAWGDAVTLQGGASSDPDGDPMTFVWRQVAGPRDVLLLGADTPTPSFQTPASGRFEFELRVGDGRHVSPPDRVSVLLDRPDDWVPIADPGPTREARVGEAVTLSAQASSDAPDDVAGENLTVHWAWGSGPRPPIDRPQDPREASFHSVMPGVHRLRLTVQDSRHTSAPADLVVVVDGDNTLPRPVAEEVAAQVGAVGQPVVLDASALRDADADALTARWRQVAGPWMGLDDPERTIARGTPTAAGRYTWALSLDDGRDRGPEVEVSVDVAPRQNAAPSADAGPDQTVAVGTEVIVDGGASVDPDGDGLSYAWTLLEAPVLIRVGEGPAWRFIASVPGDYVLSLVVSDGVASSEPAAVVVVAEPDPIERPDPGGDLGPVCDPESDPDEDGVDDCTEYQGDSDRDGLPDRQDPDDDGDGVPTVEEAPRGDSDGDGVPDRLDPDDDGDGVLTSIELLESDTDGDGVPDYLDPDDDGDDDPTRFEAPRGDSDRDGLADYLDPDDADGPGPPELAGSGSPADSGGCATGSRRSGPSLAGLSGLLAFALIGRRWRSRSTSPR